MVNVEEVFAEAEGRGEKCAREVGGYGIRNTCGGEKREGEGAGKRKGEYLAGGKVWIIC